MGDGVHTQAGDSQQDGESQHAARTDDTTLLLPQSRRQSWGGVGAYDQGADAVAKQSEQSGSLSCAAAGRGSDVSAEHLPGESGPKGVRPSPRSSAPPGVCRARSRSPAERCSSPTQRQTPC